MVEHATFLYDQAASLEDDIDGKTIFLHHPLWREVGMSTSRAPHSVSSQTIVTPSVATSFLKVLPQWATLFNQVNMNRKVQELQNYRRFTRGFRQCNETYATSIRTVFFPEPVHLNLEPTLLKDKVVTIQQSHENSTGTDISSEKLAFVVGVSGNKRWLRVIWLIRVESAIAAMCGPTARSGNTTGIQQAPQLPSYQFANELFLLKNCNCKTVKLESITAAYDVSFLSPELPSKFLIRSWFSSRECSIIDASLRDLSIGCPFPHCRHYMRSRSDTIALEEDISNVPFLNNISLFSGCGHFDNALSENPLIKTISSVDYNVNACLSIEANNRPNEKHEVHYEPINNWIERLLLKDDHHLYALQDTMISAGSPCTGFSKLNMHASNRKSQINCTLVASVVTAIEVLLPNYVIMENVPAMAESSIVCAQTVSILVALGYQVRVCKLEAHKYGAPTIRRRLFILAAAPGLELPIIPEPTHCDPREDKEPAYVTVHDVIGELPPIHNDTSINLKYPDHVLVNMFKPRYAAGYINLREVCRRIRPGGNLKNCLEDLTRAQRSWFEQKCPSKLTSRTFLRVKADGQFSTILTSVEWMNGHGGAAVHYEQHRMLSLEEQRRAMGMPDGYILIGPRKERLKQVGNSVVHQIGVVLGREIGRAWSKSWLKRATTNTGELAQQVHSPTIQLDSVAIEDNDFQNRTAEPSQATQTQSHLPADIETISIHSDTSEGQSSSDPSEGRRKRHRSNEHLGYLSVPTQNMKNERRSNRMAERHTRRTERNRKKAERRERRLERKGMRKLERRTRRRLERLQARATIPDFNINSRSLTVQAEEKTQHDAAGSDSDIEFLYTQEIRR